MSERYGACQSCGGKGGFCVEVPGSRESSDDIVPVEKNLTAEQMAGLSVLGFEMDNPTLKLVRSTVLLIFRECGVCGGTGHSGAVNRIILP